MFELHTRACNIVQRVWPSPGRAPRSRVWPCCPCCRWREWCSSGRTSRTPLRPCARAARRSTCPSQPTRRGTACRTSRSPPCHWGLELERLLVTFIREIKVRKNFKLLLKLLRKKCSPVRIVERNGVDNIFVALQCVELLSAFCVPYFTRSIVTSRNKSRDCIPLNSKIFYKMSKKNI